MTIWENSTSVSLKKTPTSWAQHDTLQDTIAFANKRKSLLVIQLENKLYDLKPLFSRKKGLTFQKRSKKMFLYWRANLADQNKQQPLKIRTIPSSQYETNLWSRHVNIVRLAKPIRRCVRWRTQVFKNRGVCLQAFPSFPSREKCNFWLNLFLWFRINYSRN